MPFIMVIYEKIQKGNKSPRLLTTKDFIHNFELIFFIFQIINSDWGLQKEEITHVQVNLTLANCWRRLLQVITVQTHFGRLQTG